MQLINILGKRSNDKDSILKTNKKTVDKYKNFHDNLWSRKEIEDYENPGNAVWNRFKLDKLAYYSLWIFCTIITICISVKLFIPNSYRIVNFSRAYMRPNFKHFFGCDVIGKDYFYKIFDGQCNSLFYCLCASILSMTIGIFFGIFVAMYGGIVDMLLFRIAEVVNSIDKYFLVVLVSSSLKLSLWQFYIFYACIYWVNVAQSIRNYVLDILHKPYVESAMTLGMSKRQIAIRHLIPHMIPMISISFLLKLTDLMSQEIIFISLGIQIDFNGNYAGRIVREMEISGCSYRVSPIIALMPSWIFMLTTISLRLISEGLKDMKNYKKFPS